jgi:hypothetical protein
MTPEKVHEMARKHWSYISDWNDKIVVQNIDELNEKGILSPRCYVLSYSYLSNNYDTLMACMPDDALSSPQKIEAIYDALQIIEKNAYYTMLCMIFVSEGTYINDGEETCFLMISFEDRIRGWKHIYTFDKISSINDDKTSSLTITNFKKSEHASASTHIPVLQKMSHIIHPNYHDAKCTIYN